VACRDDVPALVSIDRGASLNPWNEQQFEQACGDARTHAIVAELNDCVDGFVVLSQVLDEASILSIAVRCDCQKLGLGKTLLEAALVKMWRAGAERCLLEVRQSNVVARHLYQRAGFVLDGVRKNYYPNTDGREDALLMSLNLKGSPYELA
jgi:ribosomal-protein-alanine N-acetyltransferase